MYPGVSSYNTAASMLYIIEKLRDKSLQLAYASIGGYWASELELIELTCARKQTPTEREHGRKGEKEAKMSWMCYPDHM